MYPGVLGMAVASVPVASANHGPGGAAPEWMAAATVTNTAPSQNQAAADRPRSASILDRERMRRSASARSDPCRETPSTRRRTAGKRQIGPNLSAKEREGGILASRRPGIAPSSDGNNRRASIAAPPTPASPVTATTN